jgi:hypothetical protein
MESQFVERADAPPYAARLWADDAKAICRDAGGNQVIILRTATARGQDNNDGTVSLREDFQANGAASDHEALDLWRGFQNSLTYRSTRG